MTPSLGLDYAHVRLNGYRESAHNPAGLYRARVHGSGMDSFRAVVGLAFTHNLTSRFSLSARARYSYEFADEKASLSYRYASILGDAASLRIHGQKSGRSAGLVGLGMKYRLADRSSIGLDYNLHLSRKYQGHEVSAVVSVGF